MTHEDNRDSGYCAECGREWPCPAAAWVAAFSHARGGARTSHEEELEAAIDRANAEIARLRSAIEAAVEASRPRHAAAILHGALAGGAA